MKQIVRTYYTFILTIRKGEREIRQKLDQYCGYWGRWYYAEMQPAKTECITSYDEFLQRCAYPCFDCMFPWEKSKFGDKYSELPLKWGWAKFSNKNFVSCKITTEYLKHETYTLQDLIKQLPADEMIEYLKDNGLNVCPITR